jgi:hypothetical protein
MYWRTAFRRRSMPSSVKLITSMRLAEVASTRLLC